MNNQDQARAGECGTFRQLMDSFVPDDSDTDTRGALARHLENCSDCANEWQQRNRLSTRLKAAVHRQYVPSDLQMRVRGQLDGRSRGRWWQIQWTQWAISAAASLAIAFALWTTYPRTHMPAVSDRHGQEIYIQKISARLIDITVLDVSLPGLPSREVLKKLRETVAP